MPVLEDSVVLHPLNITPSPPYLVSTIDKTLPSSVLDNLNEIHKDLLLLHPQLNHIPPPPQPVPNTRSQAIQKAREEGNLLFRNQKFLEALKAYTIAINVASSRARFESSQYIREELSALLLNRCAAYMALKEWRKAEIDVRKALEVKKGVGMGKAWARLGRVLMLERKLDESREAILLGLSWEPMNEDLTKQLTDLDQIIAKQMGVTLPTLPVIEKLVEVKDGEIKNSS